MNAKARTARQIVKTRRSEAKAAKVAHTLKSHCLRAGLDDSTAGGVAGALRSKGKAIGVTGCAVRMFRRNAAGVKLWKTPVRGARRYSTTEFRTLVAAYKPRATKYVAARELLLNR